MGSTGAVALKLNRRYVGIELKRSYFDTAADNLRQAEQEAGAVTLWSGLDADEDATTESAAE